MIKSNFVFCRDVQTHRLQQLKNRKSTGQDIINDLLKNMWEKLIDKILSPHAIQDNWRTNITIHMLQKTNKICSIKNTWSCDLQLIIKVVTNKINNLKYLRGEQGSIIHPSTGIQWNEALVAYSRTQHDLLVADSSYHERCSDRKTLDVTLILLKKLPTFLNWSGVFCYRTWVRFIFNNSLFKIFRLVSDWS